VSGQDRGRSSGALVGLFNHSDKPVNLAEWLGLLAVFALTGLAALHQVRAYRRASGERRQQLKWLGSGAVVCVVLLPTFLISNAPSLVGDLVPVGLTAVPLAIGVGPPLCARSRVRSGGRSNGAVTSDAAAGVDRQGRRWTWTTGWAACMVCGEAE